MQRFSNRMMQLLTDEVSDCSDQVSNRDDLCS